MSMIQLSMLYDNYEHQEQSIIHDIISLYQQDYLQHAT